MKTKPRSGKRVVKAWAIIGSDDFLLVQNKPTMDCQMYCDPQGKVKPREYLDIYPCTISYTLPTPKKGKKK